MHHYLFYSHIYSYFKFSLSSYTPFSLFFHLHWCSSFEYSSKLYLLLLKIDCHNFPSSLMNGWTYSLGYCLWLKCVSTRNVYIQEYIYVQLECKTNLTILSFKYGGKHNILKVTMYTGKIFFTGVD